MNIVLELPWIVYVAVAALLGSLLTFCDNYVTDVLFDGKHAQAEKLVGGPVYAIAGVLLLAILQPTFSDMLPVLVLVGSGVVAGLASIPYYAGMEKEEATSALIFSQLIPVFSLVMAWVVLGQAINARQFVAFGVMMLAPVIVFFSKDKRSKKTETKAAVAFVIYGLISALSSLLFVQGTEMVAEWSFLICMALYLVGRGCADMAIMTTKRKWRKHFYREVKKQKAKIFVIIAVNTLLWILVSIMYRFALVKADALALADVSYRAIELVATFFLGVVLSLLWPKFGREKLSKRSVLAHLIATVVAVIGIVLIR